MLIVSFLKSQVCFFSYFSHMTTCVKDFFYLNKWLVHMHQKNYARAPIARILMIRQPTTDCRLHKAQIRPAFQGHNVPMILGSQCNTMHTVT